MLSAVRLSWIAWGFALVSVTGCGSQVLEQAGTAPTPDTGLKAVATSSPAVAAASAAPTLPGEPARDVVPVPTIAVSPSAPADARVTPPAAPTASQDPGVPLWDTSWLAVERTRAGQPWPFLEDGAWTVGFDSADASVMRWRGACNFTGGPVVVESTRLVVSDEPRAGSAIGCDEARNAEDQAAARFFGADPTWERSGDILTLVQGDVLLRLRLSEDSPPQ